MSDTLPQLSTLLYAGDCISLITRGESRGREVWKRFEVTVKPNGSPSPHLVYSGHEPPPDFPTPPWRGAPPHS